ncbi:MULTISPECIES: YheU family protein [unclassified Rheinheimera]|uniref:YheU family protein n=1 Tax=unclassified Rheinheimera TaxID=115860 RepID=UPI0021B13AFA|nr:YheU family protein [Rheinheimera sp. 4Y26]MCT6701273.1 YheU family protein [Rheinheimera sp. 4Y26]
MLIPYQQLNPDTLQALVEAFVLREGTDYGDFETSLADKVAMVLTQIQQGKVLIVYSEQEESVDLVTERDYRQLLAAGQS